MGRLFAVVLLASAVAGLAPASPLEASATALIPVYSHGPRTHKVIAITIDDGYRPSVCRQMVKVLRAKHVPATFFPVGTNVAKSPRLWTAIAGTFPIGNHTMHHPNLTTHAIRRVRNEIRDQAETVLSVTGHSVIGFLRPPAGAWNNAVRRVAASLGYQALLLWDTSSADTALHSKASGMIRDALRGTKGSILIMHCNRQISADILPAIIKGYRARGFKFVTIPDLFATP